MLRKRRFMTVVSLIVIAVFLSSTQFVYAADASRILGDVVGTGKAQMMTSLNTWISVTGQSFPVHDGTHLRTQDGRLSLVLKGGVRMESADKSEITVNGSRGDYRINVSAGSLGFSVPENVRFTVQTPTATVKIGNTGSIQKVSAAKEMVKGFVNFDGKGTKIVAVAGRMMVSDAGKVAVHTLEQGNTIYIGATSTSGITPVQLPTGNETASTRPMVVDQGVDRPGSDFLVTQTADAKECETLCRKNSRCVAFTFFEGKCSLKDAEPDAVAKPGATSGVYRSYAGIYWLVGGGGGTALAIALLKDEGTGQPAPVSPSAP